MKKALNWIINILNKYNINYFISGGLAAKIYGSKRDLYDIDIDVSKENILFLSSLEKIKKHIIFGPKLTKASSFKVFLMTLKYKNTLIDIGCSVKILNENKWIDDSTDLSKFKLKKYEELDVRVMLKKDLIDYKKLLARKEDLEDIKQMILYSKFN